MTAHTLNINYPQPVRAVMKRMKHPKVETLGNGYCVQDTFQEREYTLPELIYLCKLSKDLGGQVSIDSFAFGWSVLEVFFKYDMEESA